MKSARGDGEWHYMIGMLRLRLTKDSSLDVVQAELYFQMLFMPKCMYIKCHANHTVKAVSSIASRICQLPSSSAELSSPIPSAPPNCKCHHSQGILTSNIRTPPDEFRSTESVSEE